MQTTVKGETDGTSIVVGDFNTLLTSKDRSSRQHIKRATEILSDTMEQLDRIDIFKALHPKQTEYTFFSNVLGTFSRMDHIGRYKIIPKFDNRNYLRNFFSPQRQKTRNQPQKEIRKKLHGD